MKKRLDEKFVILNNLANHKIKIDMLETMYFKRVHKKQTIALWIHYPKPTQNKIAINEFHEVRTEKDIVRYFTVICDKFRKKYRPLDDKVKMCIVRFKDEEICFLTPSQLLDAIKNKLFFIVSIHFFKENTI